MGYYATFCAKTSTTSMFLASGRRCTQKYCATTYILKKPESNRERIAFGPLLITVLYLALKKSGFSKKKNYFTFFLCNFSVRTLWCFQKNFFDPEKVKKQAKKVAHNRPRPFFLTVQPRPQPTAQN